MHTPLADHTAMLNALPAVPGFQKTIPPPNMAPPRLPDLPNPSPDSNPTTRPASVPHSLAEDYSFISYLDLSTNPAHAQSVQSTGKLPTWVQKCTNLQYLIADGLGLTTIDEWVSELLIQLRVLRVPNNNITMWPDHLARLLPYDQITVIDLEANPCFITFCERCPRFTTEYAKAAGYLAPRKGLLRNGTRKKSASANRDSIISLAPPAPASRKKSGFFFSKSKKNKEVLTENEPRSYSSSGVNAAIYDDDSSDDDTLTSLEPVMPHLMKQVATNQNSSISSNASQDNMIPDKWAQRRIEGTETEKTKVLLNHLRDIWELSTHSIIQEDPNLSALASIQRSMSLSSSSTARQNMAALSPRTSYSGSSITGVTREGSRSSAAKLKSAIHNHSRLNSLEVLEKYLDEDSIPSDLPQFSPPDRTQILAMLTRTIEEEKNYVLRMGELMTIYVNSKKRPAVANKLFANLPAINQLHSNIMLGALQVCLDGYVARSDPNLTRFAELMTSNMNAFRAYIDYEIAIEESIRLITFCKRITALETNQREVQGGNVLPLGYRNADAQIAAWIQSGVHHKLHKLNGLTDYLQLPIDQLERYRILLRKLSTVTPELESAFRSLDDICSQIEQEKPKIAQQRRMAEFDQVYNMASLMARNSSMPARRYLGDVLVMLNSEARLELASLKGIRNPDVIHYLSSTVSSDSIASSTSADITPMRSNPVPKAVTRTYLKSKFNLPLHRIIVCDDVVIVTSEEKKKVLKMLDRRQVSATLPWKFPLREGPEGLPTGEVASIRSPSSIGSGPQVPSAASVSSSEANANGTPNPSSAVRFLFHDEPLVWYCTVRTFTGGRKSTLKEPRARLVELFQS